MGTPDSKGIEFKEDRPFHDMVTAFLAATMGAGDVFDPLNPRRFSRNVRSLYTGHQVRFLSIDQEQVHKMAVQVQAQGTRALLCCMLANAAYESVRRKLPRTPVTEFFRHVRNAATTTTSTSTIVSRGLPPHGSGSGSTTLSGAPTTRSAGSASTTFSGTRI